MSNILLASMQDEVVTQLCDSAREAKTAEELRAVDRALTRFSRHLRNDQFVHIKNTLRDRAAELVFNEA